MTPEGVFFCWWGGAERDFVNSAIMSRTCSAPARRASISSPSSITVVVLPVLPMALMPEVAEVGDTDTSMPG